MNAIQTILGAMAASALIGAGPARAADAPRDVAQRLNAANAALRDGDVDGALQQYADLQPLAPDNAEVTYNMAVARYRQGDFAAAEQLFRSTGASASDAVASRARYNLGNCNYVAGLELAPKDRPAALKRLETAIDDYRSALQIDSSNVDARANIELAARLIERLNDEQQQQDEQEKQERDEPNQQDEQNQENEPQSGDQQPEQEQGQEEQSPSDHEPQDEGQPNQSPNDEGQQDKPHDSATAESEPQAQEAGQQSSAPDQQQEDQSREQGAQPQQSPENPSNSDRSEDSQPQEQGQNKQPADSQPKDSKPSSPGSSKAPANQQPQQQGAPQSEPQPQDPATVDEALEDQSQQPKGALTAANEAAPKEQGEAQANALVDASPEGEMTQQEAEKMLQAIRDRDMLRRLQHQREAQRQHVPVDRDW